VSARRVLIVRVGAMGDVLHALPGVTALRRARPEWVIDWVVDPRWESLLVDGEGRGVVVNRVHLAETKMWTKAPMSWGTLRSVAGLRRALRAERYELVVDMQGTLRSAVIGRFARAKEFVGFADPREAAARRFYRSHVKRRGVHVVEQNVALLSEACELPPQPASWPGTPVDLEPAAVEVPHTEWADNWAAELVGERRVCVLTAGAGWGAKQWPVERYGELAGELKAMGYGVVVNAPRKDDAVAARVVEASKGAAERVGCNVAGLTALLRRTALVVGGDSGPTHLAAALGVPLVALYGPTDPARNGPWGTGPMKVLRHAGSVTSHKRVSEIDAGLARIAVEEVVGAVREVIQGSGSRISVS
jgi:heptosyltransferase-1